MSHALTISPARLLDQLTTLASFGGSVRGGVAREALTRTELQARQWLLARYATRPGYVVGIDAAANLHIRRLGRNDEHPPVLCGSHIDTQPLGGWLDGAFGVMAGLEVFDALDDAGLSTERSLQVVVWTNEEGSRFAPGIMGSQAYVEPDRLHDFLPVTDVQGVPFSTARDEALHDFNTAAQIGSWHRFTPELGAPLHAYLEAHIEQGPVLERAHRSVGVVEAIQGVRWYSVTVHGRSAHAGTTPRAARDDAQAKAIHLAHTLLTEADALDDEALRLTIGRWQCQPDAVNTIANRVQFSVDLRHPQAEVRELFDRLLHRLAPVGTEIAVLQDRATTPFDSALVQQLEQVAQARGHDPLRMVSGAFHDAMPLARHAPSAMLFAPSVHGISHHPDEHTEGADLAVCTQVLADALWRLCHMN